MYDILELQQMKVVDLRSVAKELGIKKIEKFKKQDLIYEILDQAAIKGVKEKPLNLEKTPKSSNKPIIDKKIIHTSAEVKKKETKKIQNKPIEKPSPVKEKEEKKAPKKEESLLSKIKNKITK